MLVEKSVWDISPSHGFLILFPVFANLTAASDRTKYLTKVKIAQKTGELDD